MEARQYISLRFLSRARIHQVPLSLSELQAEYFCLKSHEELQLCLTNLSWFFDELF